MAGGLWGLCFRQQPLILVPWIALVPLLLILDRSRPFWVGFFHGLCFWLVSIPWIAPTLREYGQLPPWMSVAGLVGLAGFLAIYQALFAGIGSRIWRCGGMAALLGLPALWVVLEWLRSHLFSGFPWNLAGQSWVGIPGALPLSSWCGIYGISFLVVFANVGVARGCVKRSWRSVVATASVCLLILAIGGRFAGRGVNHDPDDRLAVRLLQPNFEVSTAWDADQVGRDYDELFSMSRLACDQEDALVIWPESAGWPFSFTRDRGFRSDIELFARERCPLLLNSATLDQGGEYNSVLLVTSTGLEAQYSKYHLVPFGEYVPLSDWLPFLPQIARNAGAFEPGTDLAPMRWRDHELALAICYEITFPEEVARRVQMGGNVLVTVTNDGWYGDSSAPWQHFHAARFRAAENGRYLIRAALTGVSAIVAPDGSVVELLGVGDHGILKAEVLGARNRTLYTAVPWLLPVASFLLVGSAIFLSRKKGRR